MPPFAEDTPPDQVTAAQMMDDLMYGRGTIGSPVTLTNSSRRTNAATAISVAN